MGGGGNQESPRPSPDFAKLLAWLRRILLNNLANFTRQYRQTEKRALDREVVVEHGAAGKTDGLIAASATPSSLAVADEEAQTLERALERLPADYRQVLVLRYRLLVMASAPGLERRPRSTDSNNQPFSMVTFS